MKKITYPIRAVSKLTGITTDNLRAWERRYQAIQPARNDRERLYDDADVKRLVLLRRAVDAGHAISKLAVLSNAALERINGRADSLTAKPLKSDDLLAPDKSPQLKLLFEAILNLHYGLVDQELSRLAAVVSPRQLVHQIVVPLMSEIGELWYRGKLSIAQEHMASAALRGLLTSLVRLFTKAQLSSSIMFATTTGERHEFGILCAAMLSASGGLGITYLGADLPSAEILETAKKIEAKVLVLGMKAAISSKESMKELRIVAAGLPKTTELWVGGTHSAGMAREIKSAGAIYLRDFEALEKELIRVGARF
jgi:methanogenic corrinoid protein MtbC1